MKNQWMAFAAAALLSLSAQASQYKTVKVSENNNRYQVELSYPQFLEGSVPAFKAINDSLQKSIVESGCGEPEPEEEISYYYEVTVSVAEINSTYIALDGGYSDYCGGAHPNHGRFNVTFNSQTGEQLKINREFGFLDWDDPNHDRQKEEQLREQLATIMVDRLPSDVDYECYGGETRKERVEAILQFWPAITGLGKNKTVVIMTHPPHVAMPCQVAINVDYSVIHTMLNRSSYLHSWLK